MVITRQRSTQGKDGALDTNQFRIMDISRGEWIGKEGEGWERRGGGKDGGGEKDGGG